IVFPKGPHRHFQIEEQPTATILRVTTEHIDGEKEIASFRDELYRLVERIKAPRVILDFHEVLNFPSGALDPLLVARKKALDRGGELRICGLDEVLTQSIFTGNKIAAQVFGISPDIVSALESFADPVLRDVWKQLDPDLQDALSLAFN